MIDKEYLKGVKSELYLRHNQEPLDGVYWKLLGKTIEVIQSLETELEDSYQNGYMAGVGNAAQRARFVEIFDNNGIADSILQLLNVPQQSESTDHE